MKKQKEEVNNIKKSIDAKLTKKLASTLQKGPHNYVREVANAMCGMLENSETSGSATVRNFIR